MARIPIPPKDGPAHKPPTGPCTIGRIEASRSAGNYLLLAEVTALGAGISIVAHFHEALLGPTGFRVRGYRFYFFSREESRPHVHVQHASGEAKFWLEPQVELAVDYGLGRHASMRSQGHRGACR